MNPVNQSTIQSVVDFLLERPRRYLLVVGILGILAMIPAIHIEADFDLEGFYPEDADTIVEYQRISEEFGRDDTMFIVAFRHDSLFTSLHLERVRKIASELGEIPHVEEVQSIWTVQEFRSNDGALNATPYLDEHILQQSGAGHTVPSQIGRGPVASDNRKGTETEKAPDTGPGRSLEETRQHMLDDPFVEGTFLGSEGEATAIYLRIEDEKNTFSNRRELIFHMEKVLEPYQKHYEFHKTGLPYFRTRYVETLNREILFYVSLASFLIVLFLWLLFRTVIGVVLPISIVWLTILFVVGILVLTGGYFEILSSTIAPILLCVGVADSVHMLAKYQDLRLQNTGRERSLRQMILVLGSATFLTSVTTAIGFLTLMTSNVMPMRRFGIYTAIGVILAFLVTMFVLPSVLKLLKNPTPVKDKSRFFFRKIGSALSSTHRTARLHHRKVVTATLLVTLGFSLGITQLKTNSRVFDDIGDQSELIRQSRFMDEHLTPQFPLEIIVDTGRQDGVYDPDLLQRLLMLQDHLQDYDEVERSISYATLMSRVDRVMRDTAMVAGNDTISGSLSRPLPDSRALIAQYDLLLEMTGGSGSASFTDFDNRQTRVIARVYDAGSYRINRMRKDLENYLAEIFPDEDVMITGSTILSADLTGNIVEALSWSIGLAFLFISIIMALLFRNAKLVVISLLPNLIPLLITAGFMGYAGIDIRPSTAVIFTIAFGIAVDDSIHYLSRFRMETLGGAHLHAAVKNTTIHTGRAIILTSLILLVGFGVLGTSSFESNMLMGLLTCLTIFTALIADLLFLPALIYWMNPHITIGEAFAEDGPESNGTYRRQHYGSPVQPHASHELQLDQNPD